MLNTFKLSPLIISVELPAGRIGAMEVNMTIPFINFANKYIAIFSLGIALTACGGGAGTESDGNNKPLPTPSSNATQASSSSVADISSESSSQTSSSSIESSSSLANVKNSSSSETYSRASRASSSSSQESSEAPRQDIPPTKPTTPAIVLISNRNIGLSWGPASDETGISSYEILRNGAHIATTTAETLDFEDKGLVPDTTYNYAIRAVDTIGHRSPSTTPINAKTLAEIASSSSSLSSMQRSSSINSSSYNSNSSRNSSYSSKTNSTSSKATSSSSNSTSLPKSSQRASSTAAGMVNLTWDIPNQREDGSFLELYEIGGYELRHKPSGSTTFISRVIANATTRNLTLTASRSDIFEIAAYDRNGLYSKFVKITPP